MILAGIISDNGVKDTVSSIADTHDQIILALITLIGTSIAALVFVIRNNSLGKSIAKDAAEVNSAVNHTEYGEHRLYDVVRRIESKQDEFDRKWGNLPADMGDAVGLVELIHTMDRRISEVHNDLLAHVAWEEAMGQKYIPKEGP